MVVHAVGKDQAVRYFDCLNSSQERVVIIG
jgi:hypothetical protein